jgi:LPXTG-motif cell wall-anchored protein
VTAESPIKDGIKYDTTKKWIKVSVEDEGNETLTVTKTPEQKEGLDGTWTNEQLGALKFTKLLTVNGQEIEELTSEDMKNLAHGTFTFTVQSGEDITPAVTKFVEITVTNGQAVSYKIADTKDGLKNASAVNDAAWATIDNLAVGDYTITEIELANGTTLSSIVRGDVKDDGTYEGTQGPVDLENKKVTVHVTAGDTAATDGSAQATFTNNIDVGYLKVHKEVTYNGVAPATAAQKQVLAGEYTFKLYTDQNCSNPVKNGDEDVTITVTIGSDGQAKDSNVVSLPAGTYWLKEIVAEDSYVLPVGDNPKQVIITKDDTTEAAKTVIFQNNYEFNEDDDKLAVDIVKKFVGLDSEGQIPEGFKIVLSYTDGEGKHTVDLGNSAHEQNGVRVNISKSSDNLTWTWHVYNIPKGSTGFKIQEVNYNKTGYEVEVYLDGDKVNNPGEESTIRVDVPEAVLTEVTDKRITAENDLKTYYVGSDYVILVSINPTGTLVISDKSLNYLTRSAIENAVIEGHVQGSFSEPVRFFSTEQHPATIKLDSKREITVSTDSDGNQTIYLAPNTNSQATGFYVTYDNKPVYHNAEIENRYTPQGVDVDIVKIKQGSNSNPTYLPNATFSLRQIVDDVPKGNGTYESVPGSNSQTDTTKEPTGKITFKELVHGYYELTETMAPAGYVRTGDSTVYFEVSESGVRWLIKGSGKPSSWETGTNNSMITFEVAQAAVEDDTATEEDESKEATNATFIIGNTPGTQLPRTGGTGTALYTALGGLMTVTAGAILTMRRKKQYS